MKPLAPLLAALLAASPLVWHGSPALGASMDPFAEQDATSEGLNRAIALYRDGAFEDAAKAARAFLDFNPTSARGYEVLGAILGRMGDREGSLDALNTAVRLDPKLASAHANRAVLLVAEGDLASARRALEEAVTLAPDLLEAHARLAQVLEAQGDLDGAVKHYEIATQEAGGADPGVRINLAALYNRRGEHAKTAALLTLWQRDRNVDPQMHALLADAMLAQGRGDSALRQYQFALGIAPDDPRLKLGLGATHRALGENARALAVFEELREAYPMSPAPVVQLAETRAAMQEIDAADALFREAVAMAEAPRPLELRHAAMLAGAGRPAEGAAIYEAMLERDGPDADLLTALALAKRAQGDDDGARALLEQVARLYPQDPRSFARLGLHLRETGDPSAALTVVEKGLDAHPKEPTLLRIAATTARDLNELQRAIKYGEQILEINPTDMGDRFIFATLLDKAGIDAQAISLYRNVADAQRDNWAALNNLALVLARTGNAKEALTFARRARQLQPDNPAVAHTLGYVLFLNGSLGEAESLMAEAAEGLPEVGEIRYHYGYILAARSKRAEARTQLQLGLQFDPAHKEAAKAKDMLSTL